MIHRILAGVVVSCAVVLQVRAAEETIMAQDVLVGVYYFAGWWRDVPNKYIVHGSDWRTQYPERIPTLGEYNEQTTMDREIVAASEHGIDFFQILWYPVMDSPPEPHAERLNEGLRTFLASPENHRLRFTLEFVNHAPFDLVSDASWEAGCREWCMAMQHPSYLRVAGHPVFKIHSIHHLLQQFGGDVQRAGSRVERLRAIAREMGLPDLLVGTGVSSAAIPLPEHIAAFDFLSTYMDVPAFPQRAEPYPYADLLALARDGWERYAAGSPKPYVPYLPAGWDPRPWRDPRASFTFPTEEEWADALREIQAAVVRSFNLGLRVGDRHQGVFLIYAWNEFGEGGIVAPTRGEGYARLAGIRRIFGHPKQEPTSPR